MLNNNDIWNVLQNYESYDLVKSRYLIRHSREPNNALIKEICSYFILAREFFRDAGYANNSTKPLLLYYGVLNLTRGVTLFLTPNVNGSQINLKHQHGLSKIQNVEDLINLSVTVDVQGTLPAFIEVTKNKNLLRANSTRINLSFNQDYKKNKYEITLRQIVARFFELKEPYLRWQPGSSHCCRILQYSVNDTNQTLNFNISKNQYGGAISLEYMRKYFPNAKISEDKNIIYVEATNNFACLPILWDIKETLDIGDLILIEPFANEFNPTKPVATYILSYILGMLVRYYPSAWLSLVRNEKGDAAMPTLLKSVSFIENNYPQMIVNYLDEDLLLSK